MILTEQEIEERVSKVKGTWVKRKNLRKKLAGESNRLVYEQIDICKGKIRESKAMGAKEGDLRHLYSEVTKYESMILW